MRSHPPTAVAHPRPVVATPDIQRSWSALAQRSRYLQSLHRAVLVLLAATGPGDWVASRAADGAKPVHAAAADLWSFQPIRAAMPPVPTGKAWAKNPIDAFVLAKLEQNHLTPARPASR